MQLGIIGGGAMAEALVSGLLTSATCTPSQIMVSDPQPDRCNLLIERYGVRALNDNLAVAGCETLLLAIKPQVLGEVAKQLTGRIQSTLVISILAGIPLSALIGHFTGPAVVRAMPNTPALIGAGITALSRSALVSPEQFIRARTLFEAVGEVVEVSETLMDAVTGLSGSGPGYIAVMVEAFIDGGVAAGLPRTVATQLFLQTLRGSAQMLIQENLHPAALKDQVTSPGGTTIAGIGELEARSVRSACIAAVLAATERARTLGRSTE
ncbi:MAG: pyrroline-5-carboxylate reductase [Gemmatimonadaceae bacterium]|nr:pyrroline-5-carboxylate reductase [Gloeobacterales cyanobacterium ES-bin-141]